MPNPRALVRHNGCRRGTFALWQPLCGDATPRLTVSPVQAGSAPAGRLGSSARPGRRRPRIGGADTAPTDSLPGICPVTGDSGI